MRYPKPRRCIQAGEGPGHHLAASCRTSLPGVRRAPTGHPRRVATVRTDLQALAELRDEHEVAISLYLDLDRATTGTRPAVAQRTRSAIDRLRRGRPDRGREARRLFDAATESIDRFLARDELQGGGEVHGAALFARGDDVFEAHPLWRSPGDAVTVGHRFALRRLAAEQARTARLLLLIAGRELGRVLL